MTRWEALIKYDDEIRLAAEKLSPYGEIWVAKLGEAFLALDEDRKYLPNIVSRLSAEAEQSAINNLLARFSKTWEGETTSEEALRVLVGLHAKGYLLDVERSGAFIVSTSASTTYLRSNSDILLFKKIAEQAQSGG
jgi:hypothetical protein